MKILFQLPYLVLVCMMFFSCTKEKEPQPLPEGSVEVHIIIGQSNSIGRASTYALPEALQKPLENCYIYNKARNRFEVLQAGVNTQSNAEQFGPVVKAAQLLRDHRKREVYFIVAGMGNSQLHNSGSKAIQDWHPASNEILPQIKKTIDDARKALIASGKEPVIKSVAWWQGETDGQMQEKANAYLANEEALFASLDEVAYLSNTKRVVYTIFSDVPDVPYAALVNTAKSKRAAADKRTVLINANNYDRIPGDKLHATTTGQLQAGTDLFNAIKGL